MIKRIMYGNVKCNLIDKNVDLAQNRNITLQTYVCARC